MKTEVLRSIKKTEEECKSMISAAEGDNKLSIANAELEAENLIAKAQNDAEEYRKKRIADAQRDAKAEHESIISKGRKHAADLKNQSGSNLENAVEFLVTRFKGQLNV